MESETLTLTRSALIAFLRVEYGLEVAALTFVPKGMDSFGYRAETSADGPYFIKVHDPRRAANTRDLERALGVVHHLRTRCGLAGVVGVQLSRQGKLLMCLEGYPLAVFEWLEGAPLSESPLTREERVQVAQLLAALHDSLPRVGLPEPVVETFDLPFKPQLLTVLAAESAPEDDADLREVRARLERQRDDILTTLEHVERLGQWVQARHQPVITHGEPSPWNMLKTAEGRICLVDWGEVALGPAERDLVSFTGPDFVPFLRSYTQARAKRPRLYAEAFEFYIYRWALSEIADWGARLLIEGLPPAERMAGVSDLYKYLPLPHTSLTARVDAIRTALPSSLEGAE